MQEIAVIHRGDKSPRLHWHCDKAACAYFVTAICRTNSSWFEFVQQIAATKFCHSDTDFHMSHEVICYNNLSRRHDAAICRIVCLGLNGLLYKAWRKTDWTWIQGNIWWKIVVLLSFTRLQNDITFSQIVFYSFIATVLIVKFKQNQIEGDSLKLYHYWRK